MKNFVRLMQYLPELKASHPHQSTNSPMTAFTGEPRGSGASPMSYRPRRGPSIIADASAANTDQQFSVDFGLTCCGALKMEVVYSYETLVPTYKSAKRRNTEDQH